MQPVILLKEQCDSVEEGGPEHSQILWSKPWRVGEVSRPSKLRDPTTDPGAPSYRQPLLNLSPKKPRLFSQWITTEHPHRRGNGGCADSSGNLPCPREHSRRPSTMTVARQSGDGACAPGGRSQAQPHRTLRHPSEWEAGSNGLFSRAIARPDRTPSQGTSPMTGPPQLCRKNQSQTPPAAARVPEAQASRC